MLQNPFQLTLWDVGHGLSVWIQTPTGHNHWVDTGYLPGFSPSENVYSKYGVRKIDFLTISHADKDHFDDLHNFLHYFGLPRVFHRNLSVPADQKYGSLTASYQQALKQLEQSHTAPVPSGQEPWDPRLNGGVTIQHYSLDWSEARNINDSSVVTFYHYAGWLFILPGDIGPSAWTKLWLYHGTEIAALIANSSRRILVAPHHGRTSGYSEELITATKPSLILVSDEYGKEPTDYRFRSKATGLEHNRATGNLKRISPLLRLLERPQPPITFAALLGHTTTDIKYLSMKSTGRLQFRVDSLGECNLHIVE